VIMVSGNTIRPKPSNRIIGDIFMVCICILP
jgi:hypothetical protein